MKEHCFYIIKDEFFDKFEKEGSTFEYNKSNSRPTFCCFEDKIHKGLFWAIPAGRAQGKNIERIRRFMSYDFETDIRASYYYLGYTNQKAIFYISSAFPVTEKYILRAYTVQNSPLEIKRISVLSEIEKRMLKILTYENHNPNVLETHISNIKKVLLEELEKEQRYETTT